MIKVFIHILFLTLLGSLLSGCVGSIENAAKDLTDANKTKDVKIEFAGITEAVAISHNKVSVGFKPATGGSEHFSYLVYLNGQYDLASASIDSSLVKLDSSGVAHVVVGSLSTGTTYSFAVRAYDPENNVSDTNTVVLTAQTINTEVPNFDGVYKVSNVAGKSGENSLFIQWNKAISSLGANGSFGGDVHDVSGYMIYYGESALDMSTMVPVNGADTLSYTLSGLKDGTDYFIRVRARDSNTPVNNEEANIHYLVKKTLTSRPITFEGVKSLEIPTNRSGYHNMTVRWDPGSGSFDSYKVYISSSLSAFQGNRTTWNPANFEWIDSLTDTSETSKSYYLSLPNKEYYVAVVACLSGDQTDCDTFVGSTSVKSLTTKPPVVPFAGIKDVGGLAPVAGLAGLTDINVYWDTPNTELGVYKRIEIFKCDDTRYLNPLTNVTNNGVYALNASLRITGLETGKEYCLLAIAVEDIDSDPRFSTTRTLRYVTPNFIPPSLPGLSACSAKTSSGFKVNWSAAVGEMFTSYELFIKKKMTNDLFDWDKAIVSANQASSLNDFLSNSNKYFLNYLSTSDSNYTFSNLESGTTYQVGIRTFLTNGSKIYRSNPNPSVPLECSTEALQAYHNGWIDVFAIGPKYDGVDNKFVAERLATNTETGSHALYKHMFPVEDSSIIPTKTGSLTGIIRINWKDFRLSNGKNIIDNPLAGYKVYRKNHSSLYDSGLPSISEPLANNGWDLVSGDTLIKPTAAILNDQNSTNYGTNTSYGQFIDYTAPHSSDPNEGTIYYYRVEAYVGDTHIDYAPLNLQAFTGDLIIRVVLPPKNMAFMHRWMANKQMCEEMGKTSDRNNNYRCSYNGLGASQIGGNWYYDMKGDTFIDRFKLACPFSRGNTAYKCTETFTNSFPNFDGRSGGSVANTPNAKGIYKGDCIGRSGDPSFKIYALPGTIFYDALNGGRCYVNTSSSSCTSSPSTCSTWKVLEQIDSLVNYQPAVAGPGTALGDFLDYSLGGNKANRSSSTTKIPPQSSTFPSGQGWGARIYSNDAGLPYLTARANSLNWTCQSASFTVNNIIRTKRLLRRKEQMAAYAPSPFLDRYGSVINTSITSGSYLTDALIATGSLQAYPNGTNVNSGIVDRDCYSNNLPLKFTGLANGNLSLNARSSNDWTTRIYAAQGALVDANSTGSSGSVSTDACITRFGLQDYMGGSKVVLSDTMYCNKSTKFCSFAYKDKTFTNSFTPPWDSANKENWRNAVNYATFSNDQFGNNPNRLGGPLLYQEKDPNTVSGAQYVYSFTGSVDLARTVVTATDNMMSVSGMRNYSLAMGLPLMCAGNSCTYNGAYTDDTTFALQPLGSPSFASIQLDTNIYNNKVYLEPNAASGGYSSMVNSSFANGQSEFTVTPTVGWTGDNVGPGQWDQKGLGYFRRSSFWMNLNGASGAAYCSQLVEDYSTP